MKRIFGHKKMLLSIAALVLILVFSVSATQSWIENIYHVQFDTNDDSENKHPMSISDNIDAELEVTDKSDTIQLGRIIQESQSGGTTTRTITNKGYFYESGDMHLSPCYGNGESFYFPVGAVDGTAASYRLGNHDDENVNYISMTLKVSSPDAKTEYWFENFDVTLKDKDGNTVTDADDYIRFSVTSDGSTSVYSKDGSYKEGTGVSTSPSIKSGKCINDYKYAATNIHSYRKMYGNTLFAVPKGKTKIVNFKLWLEKNSDINSVAISDIDIRLSSSWAKTRRIALEDKTTGAGANSWIGNDEAELYLCIPSLDPDGWYDDDHSSDGRIKLESSSVDTSGNRYVEIPAVYNGEKMYIIRTNGNGFKNESNNSGHGSATYKIGGTDSLISTLPNTKPIYGWNYWSTNIPDTFCDETYSVYGGSYDGTAAGYYKDSYIAGTSTKFGDKTYLGYGTWSGVMEIKIINSSSANGNYVYNNSADITKTHLFVEDYSDWISAGKVYVYTMYCYETVNSKDRWKVYVPKTSTKIEFYYCDRRNPNRDRYWGFSSQSDATTIKNSYSFDSGYSRPSGTQYNTFEYGDTFSDNNNKNGKGIGTWTTGSSSGTSSTTASTAASSGSTTEITTTATSKALYAYGNLDGSNTNKNAKFTSKTAGGYIILQFNQGTTYDLQLRYGKDGTGWDVYGRSSYDGPTLSSSEQSCNAINASGQSQRIKLTISETGRYKIYIDSINGDTIALKFKKL